MLYTVTNELDMFTCKIKSRLHLYAQVIGETELRVGDVDLRNPIKMWLNLRDIDDVSMARQ